MKYICKNCGYVSNVKDLDTIVKMEKLCKLCFSKDEDGRKRIAFNKSSAGKKWLEENKNTNIRRDDITGKGKKIPIHRVWFWQCTSCGKKHSGDKPYKCKGCGYLSLRKVLI